MESVNTSDLKIKATPVATEKSSLATHDGTELSQRTIETLTRLPLRSVFQLHTGIDAPSRFCCREFKNGRVAVHRKLEKETTGCIERFPESMLEIYFWFSGENDDGVNRVHRNNSLVRDHSLHSARVIIEAAYAQSEELEIPVRNDYTRASISGKLR